MHIVHFKDLIIFVTDEKWELKQVGADMLYLSCAGEAEWAEPETDSKWYTQLIPYP